MRILTICLGLTAHALLAAAQSPTPWSVALSGSIVARDSSRWSGISNPAALRERSHFVGASYAPTPYGIKGLSDATLFATTRAFSIDAGTAIHALAFGPLLDTRISLIAALPLAPTLRAGGSVVLRLHAVSGYDPGAALSLDAGMLFRPLPWLTVGANAANLTGSAVAGRQSEQRIQLGVAAVVADSMRLSVDVAHQLRRPATMSLGLSMRQAPGIELLFGAALYPPGLSFGIDIAVDAVNCVAATEYVAPLGFRSAIGVGIVLEEQPQGPTATAPSREAE